LIPIALVVRFPLVGSFVVVTLGAYVVYEITSIRRRCRALIAARAGESICTFARSFDVRSVDTWVIRAVYEDIQQYLGLPVPIRPTDNLIQDLYLDPEALELDLAQSIALKSGRTLLETESNPKYMKVFTVDDLVMFFNAQPRRPDTDHSRICGAV
jgi:hypothetical protein